MVSSSGTTRSSTDDTPVSSSVSVWIPTTMSSRTSRLSISLSRSSVSRVKTTAGRHLLPTRLPGYRRGSDIGELTGEICADAFFQNVCELDLVFSFYKVSRDGFAWMGTLLRGDYGYRCMRSWTKCSWLGRLKRRASKWCWTDWTTWRSWVNLAFICSVTVEYVIVYPVWPTCVSCRVYARRTDGPWKVFSLTT